MTRTQIYLPDDTHAQLLQIARTVDQSLSQLIREGADMVIKAKTGELTPSQRFIKSILSYPDSNRVKLSKSAVKLVREQRD